MVNSALDCNIRLVIDCFMAKGFKNFQQIKGRGFTKFADLEFLIQCSISVLLTLKYFTKNNALARIGLCDI